jgi:DMSO/TMAO reductase YedYZ molybdopterin-dependent catalytic subunit
MRVGRRQFAKALASTGVAVALERWTSGQSLRPVTDGRLIRIMPLGRFDGRPTPPMHTLLGTGLDARQFTDLSTLDTDHLLIPTERFYIRTAQPPTLPAPDAWRLVLGGLVDQERTLDLRTLERDTREIGTCLMECAGNADPANFGLLSAATWSGVPLSAVLEHVRKASGAARVRVSGVDDEGRPSVTSNPGASWVFTAAELERTGAFLAVAMNDAPLTGNHGAPVRLIVPNYYGCSCIKWSSRVDWVADDEPATTQMMEFSARTHQAGVPRFARDYEPPVIDAAATPIRVEQWAVTREGGERISYRVVGIRWGGTSTRPPLTIRFRSNERFVPVADNPPTSNPATWSLWSHEWTPGATGRYQIALRVADPSVRARRLGMYYYTREVEIDRV